MKKILILVLIIILFAFSACASETQTNSTPVSQPTVRETNEPVEVEENIEEESTSEVESTSINNENNVSSMAITGGSTLHPGIYVVGKDINEGRYLITCTESDWGMMVILFENEDKYGSYMSSERFTIGEESRAIEQNALVRMEVPEDNSMFVGLLTGMVLKIENGIGQIDELDNLQNLGSDFTIYPGVYFVGRDINIGRYVIKCIEANWGMNAIIFENTDKYRAYKSAEKFTVGEEHRAIELNALVRIEIQEEESMYVGLETGMVLIIRNGVGQASLQNELSESDSEFDLFTGVYFVGRDINEGRYVITCIESSWSMSVIVFEDMDKYRTYMSSERFTIGEENQAIEQNAMLSENIWEGDTLSIRLEDGMVLKVRNGTGTAVLQ